MNNRLLLEVLSDVKKIRAEMFNPNKKIPEVVAVDNLINKLRTKVQESKQSAIEVEQSNESQSIEVLR